MKKSKKSNKKKNIKKNNVTNKEQLEKELKLQEEKNNKKQKKQNIIIFVIYAIILSIVATFHETWRDEAQSWLIAKNLGFLEIISQLKYEGHPFLWYYILKIFTIFKLSYKYITIIPILLNLTATYIFLNKSKLNKFINIIIIFSSGIFFYCGILARSYSLAYLLIMILATIYKNRYKKPIYYGLLIFSIMNTHILLLGFIGSLILIDIYEYIKNKENRKSIIKSMTFFIAGIVTLFIQFCSTMNSTGKTIQFENLNNILSQTKILFMPAVTADIFYILTIITIIVYIIYLINEKEIKNLIILSCGILFQILFATLLYNSMNASSLIYLNILFVIMQSKIKNNTLKIITIVIFISTLYSTYLMISNDYKYLFSDSKNVANWIKENVESDSKIYCELLDYCASINAHLPENKYKFIDYNTEKEYTYTEYGDYYKILYDQTIYKSENFLEEKQMDYYIGSIYNKEILEDLNEKETYTLVYETDKPIFYSGEGYVIYKHN